jgi:hypothetical protein
LLPREPVGHLTERDGTFTAGPNYEPFAGRQLAAWGWHDRPMSLADDLAEWADVDGAQLALGKAIGVFTDVPYGP